MTGRAQAPVPYEIIVRAATQADLDKLSDVDKIRVDVSLVDGAAVVELPRGNPIAFTDEYGTATVLVDQLVTQELVEKLVEAASSVYIESLA